MIFIGLLFFYTSMNTIRQYMAISVILLGFKFVKNKKIIPYLITILIAYLFHSSALVGLLIYPIYNTKYTHLRVIIIFAIAIVANVFVSDIINYIYNLLGRINYYDSRVGQENIANMIYMIIYFIMFLFSLFEIKKNKEDYSKKSFYLYVFVMSSAFSLIAMNMNVLARVTTYFNVFSIICLPNIIEDNIKKINAGNISSIEPTSPEPTGLTKEELVKDEMVGKYVDYKSAGKHYIVSGKYSESKRLRIVSITSRLPSSHSPSASAIVIKAINSISFLLIFAFLFSETSSGNSSLW